LSSGYFLVLLENKLRAKADAAYFLQLSPYFLYTTRFFERKLAGSKPARITAFRIKRTALESISTRKLMPVSYSQGS
jgi:hypothetical protein